MAGNRCDVLTVTNFNSPEQEIKKRKCVCISARVHPGETGASWMMKGVLDYLLGFSDNANVLRQKYLFKLVPMLNPDGVINGNTRCNLSGVDLNRHWMDPSPKLHPTAFHYKQMVKQMK